MDDKVHGTSVTDLRPDGWLNAVSLMKSTDAVLELQSQILGSMLLANNSRPLGAELDFRSEQRDKFLGSLAWGSDEQFEEALQNSQPIATLRLSLVSLAFERDEFMPMQQGLN